MGHYRGDREITYSLVEGTGALTDPQYFWWDGVTVERDSASADWSVRVRALNPEDVDREDEGRFPLIAKDIRHEDVVKAVNAILGGEVVVSPGTTECCRKLVRDPEYGHLAWDHWVSDELIQVIVYGKSEF